ARGGAAAVLPAALLGAGVAVLLTPGPASWLSAWLAAGVIGTALAGPPLLVVWQHRARRAAAPAALAPAARRRMSAARRWVADGASSAMARGAVRQAGIAAPWQAVGAGAVVAAPPPGPGLTPAARRLITGGPGVQRAATISVTTGTSGQGVSLPVAVVDPPQYAALAAGTPAPRFPAAALARPAGGAAPAGAV